MNEQTILQMVKARLGISTTVRDEYLTQIVLSVLAELKDEKGLVLDSANPYHLMFVVDYATWRYQNRDSHGAMPRHLQFRLHNLIIHVGSANLRVDSVVTVDTLPVEPDKYTVYILSTDDTKQMYLDGQWTLVDMVNGVWVVVT